VLQFVCDVVKIRAKRNTCARLFALDWIGLLLFSAFYCLHSPITATGARYRRSACRVPVRDTDELRQRLVATRAEFQQNVVYDAMNHWRKRLEACSYAEYDHFEHFLWRCLPDILVAIHHNRFFSEPPMPIPTTGSIRRHQHLTERNKSSVR